MPEYIRPPEPRSVIQDLGPLVHDLASAWSTVQLAKAQQLRADTERRGQEAEHAFKMLSLWGSKALPAVAKDLEAVGIPVPRDESGKVIIPSKLQLQELMEETQANLLRDKGNAEMLALGALGGYKALKEIAETRRAEAQEQAEWAKMEKTLKEASKIEQMTPYEIEVKRAQAAKDWAEVDLSPLKKAELQQKIATLAAQAARASAGDYQVTNVVGTDEQGRPRVMVIERKTGKVHWTEPDTLVASLYGKESKGPGTTADITDKLFKDRSDKNSPLRKVKPEGLSEGKAKEIAQYVVQRGIASADAVRIVQLESGDYRVEITPKDGHPPIRIGGLFQPAVQPAKPGKGTWITKGPSTPSGIKSPAIPLRFGPVSKEKIGEWAQKLRELTSGGIGVDPWAYSNSAMVQEMHELGNDLRAAFGKTPKEKPSQEKVWTYTPEMPDWFKGYFFRPREAEEEEMPETELLE